MKEKEEQDFIIGLILGMSSSIFIGSSFIFKKKALLKLSLRAGQGGYGYLKEWMWWAGMILMGVGEVANFSAYAFVPATLVTPLGALSVLVSAVLASHFLDENLNLLGKLGCVICLLGSTIFVIHAPKEQDLNSMEELGVRIQDPGFVLYAIVVVITVVVLIAHTGPRSGHSNPFIYTTITGLMGSLTVMGCKGLGIALKQTFNGENQLTNPLTWFVIIGMLICLTTQLNYLNKALDLFNTAVVTLILYVIFTSCVILASAILFKEWSNLSAKDIVGNMCGFSVVICGVFLVQAFKDLNISAQNLSRAKKENILSQNLSSDKHYTRLNDTVYSGVQNLRAT